MLCCAFVLLDSRRIYSVCALLLYTVLHSPGISRKYSEFSPICSLAPAVKTNPINVCLSLSLSWRSSGLLKGRQYNQVTTRPTAQHHLVTFSFFLLSVPAFSLYFGLMILPDCFHRSRASVTVTPRRGKVRVTFIAPIKLL